VAEGDKVVTRKTFHGTHRGAFMGLPPTGNAVSFDVIDIVRIRDGQLIEHWNVVDQLTLLRQLGLVPNR
jgi:predicted ester cyclase